jgi:DNA-binding GntR family transcriptional regulator
VSNPKLVVQPIEVNFSLKDKIYDALKQAITSMIIHGHHEEHRLDERQLSKDLGVSRTPIREALARLEQEGFVRILQRKGAFVVRKTKKEILEMILVWAALESTAARLITLHASDEEISTLRKMFTTFESSELRAHIDEYSDTNIRFHQTLIKMSHCDLLHEMTENLFTHMRSIRQRTISQNDRAEQSIIDHMHIIEALEQRDTELAEQLVRQHTLNLAAHVEKNLHDLN